MRKFIVFIIFLSIFSCEYNPIARPSINGFGIYTIQKGSYQCDGWRYYPTDTMFVSFDFYFDSSAYYDNSIVGDDWNKVFGVSNGDHLMNSARFSWKCSDSNILLGYFCHVNGRMVYDILDTIIPKEIIHCGVGLTDSGWKFVYIKNMILREFFVKTVQKKSDNSYLLMPYFGGDNPAPHKIKVYIKKN